MAEKRGHWSIFARRPKAASSVQPQRSTSSSTSTMEPGPSGMTPRSSEPIIIYGSSDEDEPMPQTPSSISTTITSDLHRATLADDASTSNEPISTSSQAQVSTAEATPALITPPQATTLKASSKDNLVTSTDQSISSTSAQSKAPPSKKQKLENGVAKDASKKSDEVRKAETAQAPKKPKMEQHTIVTSLKALMRTENPVDYKIDLYDNMTVDPAALMRVLDNDQKDLTAVMLLTSIYMNWTFRHILANEDETRVQNYFNNFSSTDIQNFVYTVQGKKGRKRGVKENVQYVPMFREFVDLKNRVRMDKRLPESFPTENRSTIYKEAAKLFGIALKNNIIINMPRRLVRYFRSIAGMTRKEAWAHVKEILGEPFEIDTNLGVSFTNLKEQPYSFIPFLYRLQKIFRDNEVKNFVVVPRNRARAKFIHISNTGLTELLARFGEESQQRIPPKSKRTKTANHPHYWNFFFKLEDYDRPNSGNKLKGILTNGVQVNLIYERPKVKKSPPVINQKGTTNHNVELYRDKQLPEEFDRIIAYDPGRRLTVAGIIVDYMEEQPEEFQLHSRVYNHSTGYNKRKIKRERRITNFEGRMATERRQFGDVSPFAEDYNYSALYELSTAKERLEFYSKAWLRWERFHHYVERNLFIDNYVSQLCPVGRRTLVYAGNAKFGHGIKGYVPASLNRFEAAFKRHPRATLRLVDEFRTSKLCHACHEVLAGPSGWSTHRWKRCDNCHMHWNRDINAGYNMVTVGLANDYSKLGHKLPEKMSRSYKFPPKTQAPTLAQSDAEDVVDLTTDDESDDYNSELEDMEIDSLYSSEED